MNVDGQPVSARLAWGSPAHSSGLVLTDVGSYLGTSTGQVGVIFRVRNVSNHDVTTGSPPFLPVLSPRQRRPANHDDSALGHPRPAPAR
jgi:hypothetical protein